MGALFVAAACVGPFVVWSPGAYIDGAILFLNDLDRYPRLKWIESRAWVEQVGLAGAFWTLGLERLLAVLQLGAVAAGAVLAARSAVVDDPLPRVAAAVLASFVVLNAVVWPYYYEPAIVVGLLAAATHGRDRVG